MRVLIADDEYLARFSLRSMLEELDPQVEIVGEAANGEELASEACTLDIRADLDQNDTAPRVRIEIHDNGSGFDPQCLDESKGLGLTNVLDRLVLAFREAAFSVISQIDSGTRIVIEIPISN